MSDLKRVNGNIVSWGSAVAKVDGERYYGFVEVSYADKRERQYVHGMGKAHAPRGRTRGKYTPEPSKIKGPVASIEALCSALAAKSSTGTSYGDVEFPFVFQWVESEGTFTVELERCVITGRSGAFAEGPDGMFEEIEVMPMLVRRNGNVLFDESDGTP